jgi:outer membrane lipoprotein-sorting protein
MARKTLRWLPAVVVPAVIIAGALVVPLTANAAADLPAKTPQQLLELVGQNTVATLSGTVEQTSKLGLPELPTSGKSAAGASGGTGSALDPASLLELLTGSHTARVYLDGPDQARVQVLDQLAERDVVRNGRDVWLWDSSHQAATHVTLPEHQATPGTGASTSPQDSTGTPTPTEALTPAQLAKQLLAAVDPSTAVTVGGDTQVAGRGAYTLVLDPRSSTTLVHSVSIAVDAKTGLPLSVTVTARGQKDPAFQLAFTKLSLDKPSGSRFTFVPPKGATVTEQPLPAALGKAGWRADSSKTDRAAMPHPSVIGTGWDAIAALPAGSVPAELTASPLFGELTESVAGGRLLSTSLLTVLITDDGRVFAGAVPAQALNSAASAASTGQ